MSSILAIYKTKTVSLPADPDNVITIRKLSGGHLRKARRAQMFESLEMVQAMGGIAEFNKRLRDEEGDDAEVAKKVEEAQKDPASGYDYDTVLRYGVVSWTYPDKLKPETLGDELDEQAQEFLVRAILEHTLPPATDEAKEAAEKNA